MKQTGKCPKCGSSEIVADAKAIDRGEYNAQHEMSVATFVGDYRRTKAVSPRFVTFDMLLVNSFPHLQ